MIARLEAETLTVELERAPVNGADAVTITVRGSRGIMSGIALAGDALTDEDAAAAIRWLSMIVLAEVVGDEKEK